MDVTRFLLPAAISLTFSTGCGAFFVSREDGDAMQKQLEELKTRSAKLDADSVKLKTMLDDYEAELKKMRSVVEEATKVVTRNSADVGLTVQKLQVDLAAVTGRVDDLSTNVTALGKSFNDYRASSDTKLEQLVNATTAAKNPPIPETPDGAFAEAKKRYDAKQWNDARRVFDAFIARYSGDARAAQAQYFIGESYLAEQKYANAINAFSKVIDNYAKSELVPDAMFKNGEAFYALKYCGDARIYFQELLRRYPKTEWKKDANEELKKLQKDAKNKSVCQS
jgi:tol-pal system protein YbgF